MMLAENAHNSIVCLQTDQDDDDGTSWNIHHSQTTFLVRFHVFILPWQMSGEDLHARTYILVHIPVYIYITEYDWFIPLSGVPMTTRFFVLLRRIDGSSKRAYFPINPLAKFWLMVQKSGLQQLIWIMGPILYNPGGQDFFHHWPPGLWIMWYYPYQLLQDFFHQQ